jgi:hypothetical protein
MVVVDGKLSWCWLDGGVDGSEVGYVLWLGASCPCCGHAKKRRIEKEEKIEK